MNIVTDRTVDLEEHKVTFECDGRFVKRMIAVLYDWDVFIEFCNTGKYPDA